MRVTTEILKSEGYIDAHRDALTGTKITVERRAFLSEGLLMYANQENKWLPLCRYVELILEKALEHPMEIQREFSRNYQPGFEVSTSVKMQWELRHRLFEAYELTLDEIGLTIAEAAFWRFIDAALVVGSRLIIS